MQKGIFIKQIIIALLLLLTTAQFAKAELTKNDLREIEKLLDKQQEEMKNYIDARTEVLDARIKALDTKIDQKFEVADTRIKALDMKINQRFDTLDTKINQKVETINATIAGVEKAIKILQWVIGILALFLASGIVLPTVWQELRERRRTSLGQRIEKLEQELDKLKEQKIVR